jgi:hypothetical protein
MFLKRTIVSLLRISLITIFFLPVFSQMEKFAQVKGVGIPFNLKCDDSIFKKGKFDFEVYRSAGDYFLKIKRKGKTLCFVQGRREWYDVYGLKIHLDPNIPDKPRLQITRNPKEKILNIIFESGKKAKYPFLKIIFRVSYQE